VRSNIARERRVPGGFGIVDSPTGQLNETHPDSACLTRLETNARVIETRCSAHPHHSVAVHAQITHFGIDNSAECAECGVKSWAHPRMVTPCTSLHRNISQRGA